MYTLYVSNEENTNWLWCTSVHVTYIQMHLLIV